MLVSATVPIAPVPVEEDTAFIGHPRGLFVLFFAEMWERFSYYGMRALLIFYLTKHFLFGDAAAAGIVTTYGSLVYLTPVLGGLIADRYLGARRAVIFGAILLCFGHLGMAIEGAPAHATAQGVVRADWSLQVLYLSLALIITGVGFLKANISTMVGQLYGPNDARRDGGFTLFYMGINLGAFIAALVCGYLGETYGWSYGFGLAGVGMLAGLFTFIRGQAALGSAGEPPDLALLKARLSIGLGMGLSRQGIVYVGGLLAVVVAWQLIQQRAMVGTMLQVTAVGAVAGIVLFSFLRCAPVERDRMLLLLVLTAISVVFWALFEQAGTSLNLFTDRNVDREMFGTTVAASQFQSVNPAFIILLAPLFSRLWPWLAARGYEPSTPAKFGLAVVQVGLGFLALVYGATRADAAHHVGVFWLVLAYFLHTTGELCLSPVGLSAVSRLSVPRAVGLMMGVWFLASAFAQNVAGIIAALMSVQGEGGATADAGQALATYVSTFNQIAWGAIAIGALVLLVSPLLRQLMHAEALVHAPGLPRGSSGNI